MAVVTLLLGVLLPAVQYTRESSRASQCRNNLRQLGVALQNYEAQFRLLPPAVTWAPAGEPLGQSIAAPGSIDRVSLGIASATDPDRIRANWAISLLPTLEEESLYRAFDLRVRSPIPRTRPRSRPSCW